MIGPFRAFARHALANRPLRDQVRPRLGAIVIIIDPG